MSRKVNGLYIVSDKLTVERYNMEGNIYSIIEELQNVRDKAVDMGMVNEGGAGYDSSHASFNMTPEAATQLKEFLIRKGY